MILLEQSPQVARTGRMSLLFSDYAGAGKGLVDLLVEFLSVRDDDKGPVAGSLAQDLVLEKDHGHAFPPSLGVPKDAQATFPSFDVVE